MNGYLLYPTLTFTCISELFYIVLFNQRFKKPHTYGKKGDVLHMNDKKTETIKRRYNRISGVFDMMDNMIKEDWRKELI
ncbi:hypothetical protein [Virgibacillus pantothenticus]|uniref:hypothetical protein n=1 Tax=Virgibacillus pantothenticus TaxID=1473 RepID=UPI0020148EC0|nr:hypothetical protein [Virgibacillus pantothenticus]